MIKHATDRWLRHRNCILLFDDIQLENLVRHQLEGDLQEIESAIERMVRDVKFGVAKKVGGQKRRAHVTS